jgi:hypothetical protein
MGLLDDIFGKDIKTQVAVPNMVGTVGCVTKSLYDAMMWKKKYGDDVQIAISKIDAVKDVDHAQAIATVKGKYTPLTSHEYDGVVRPWTMHFPEAKPYRHVTVDQFLVEQKDNLDPDTLIYLNRIRK